MSHPSWRRSGLTRLALCGTLAAGGLSLAALGPALAQADTHEITINITRVSAIDRADEFSKGDFYARVTIDGETQSTQPVKQQNIDKPDWKISKKVKPGVVNVKLEILDKDVSQDDPIDINRVENKRWLDFSVDTRKCRVSGFSSGFKCGATITRAGAEKKAAEVSFNVTVKK